MQGATIAEVIGHCVCLVLTVIGSIMVGVTINDLEVDGTADNSILFTFACGCLMSFMLLINAGRAFPAFLPITVALGYFWFPRAITYCDAWRSQLEGDHQGRSKSDLQVLVAGCILSLAGTFLGIIFECLFPKETRRPAVKLLEGFGVLASLVSFAGAICLWVNNDKSFAYFSEYQRICIQGALATIFSLDSILFPDPDLVIVGLFMCTYTACEAVYLGIPFRSTDNKDLENSQIGLMVHAAGLALMLIVATFSFPKRT
eukprot:c4561_g1_i1.p1 GENE.c4561_g1_i1~~c4561_g1_i1.p1  ORF type:complete len:259 (+),score=41.42 c4561_g1_i1:49-825(+)